jgi:thiamine biosynthesis protein ThiI
VRDSKIVPLIEKILAPQKIAARLFLVPYDVFQIALLGANADPSLEVALFRRFIVRVANRIAAAHGHLALVTGDNIAQVASQTLEGIIATDDAAERPMLRPLLTYEKQEIIAVAERIGTYELATQDYRDCCSLSVSRPATKPRLQAVRAAEATFDIERVVERALAEMVAWKIESGQPPKPIVFATKFAATV